MVSVDNENKENLRVQSWVLAVRLFAVSLGIMVIPDAKASFATLLGCCLTAIVATLLLTKRNCWLPYCYLGAAGLWAGYGTALCIQGTTGVVYLFIICLIVVDAFTFVSSWKRRWL